MHARRPPPGPLFPLAGLLLAAIVAGCSESPPDETTPPMSDTTPAASSSSRSQGEGAAPEDGRGVATFGGGCFWCTEAVFQRLRGVLEVTSGYAGGHVEDPSYAEVTSGRSGHAEVVSIAFDPARISYEDLLDVFFHTHDPTTPNRQGADVGRQYRSIVLWHDEAQREAAEKKKRELDAAGVFDAPIVTEIAPYTTFYPAEGYHQDYFASNPQQPYCQVVIRPKLDKFEERYAELLRDDR